jgi:hypothetical protein
MTFSFFSWILSLIPGRNDPGRAKRRELKKMAKALAANKYGNFYLPKTGEATPALAEFFFGVYRVVASAQTLLQDAAQSTRLQEATIRAFLEEGHFAILDKLSPESISLRAEQTPHRELARQLQDEFDGLAEAFDEDRKNAINDCYALIMAMAKFVGYDYFFLLRRFDSQLSERSLLHDKPRFVPAQGKAVADQIKDFLEMTGGLDLDRDWAMVFRVLRSYKGVEVVSRKLWAKLLAEIRDIKRSGILEMMIRFIAKDPDWGWEPHVSQADITAGYLEAIRLEIFDQLNMLAAARENAQIAESARAVFGDADTERLKHYTEEGSEVYERKDFIGFTLARGLNYLTSFLADEDDELQFLYNLILIRSQWVSPAMSLPLSESVRLLEAIPGKIKALDDSVADQGPYGSRLGKALQKLSRSKSQARFINANLEDLNDEARQIIAEAALNLSVLADSLRDILEDCRRSIPLLIMNWEQLESFSEGTVEGRLDRMHKRLAAMLRLLRLFARDSDDADEADEAV